MDRKRVVSINLRLDEELHAELKQLADEEERSIANLIRRILRQAIEQRRGGRQSGDQPE